MSLNLTLEASSWGPQKAPPHAWVPTQPQGTLRSSVSTGDRVPKGGILRFIAAVHRSVFRRQLTNPRAFTASARALVPHAQMCESCAGSGTCTLSKTSRTARSPCGDGGIRRTYASRAGNRSVPTRGTAGTVRFLVHIGPLVSKASRTETGAPDARGSHAHLCPRARAALQQGPFEPVLRGAQTPGPSARGLLVPPRLGPGHSGGRLLGRRTLSSVLTWPLLL